MSKYQENNEGSEVINGGTTEGKGYSEAMGCFEDLRMAVIEREIIGF